MLGDFDMGFFCSQLHERLFAFGFDFTTICLLHTNSRTNSERRWKTKLPRYKTILVVSVKIRPLLNAVT